VLILNNDVVLASNLIETLLAEIGSQERFVINPMEFTCEGEFRSIGIFENWFSVYLAPLLRFNGSTYFYPSTACCLTTRVLLQNYPLNEDIFMYEDTEWGWRLQLVNIPMLWTSKSFYWHKVSGSAETPLSPKIGFYVGLSTIGTCFICMAYSSMLVLSPLFFLNYLRHTIRFLRLKKYESLLAYNQGFLMFFNKIKIFKEHRKAIQRVRKIGEFRILGRGLRSVFFAKSNRKIFGPVFRRPIGLINPSKGS
jgi:GT2 family glycosyltransferase